MSGVQHSANFQNKASACSKSEKRKMIHKEAMKSNTSTEKQEKLEKQRSTTNKQGKAKHTQKSRKKPWKSSKRQTHNDENNPSIIPQTNINQPSAFGVPCGSPNGFVTCRGASWSSTHVSGENVSNTSDVTPVTPGVLHVQTSMKPWTGLHSMKPFQERFALCRAGRSRLAAGAPAATLRSRHPRAASRRAKGSATR